jgi:hypothetical protein
MRGVVEDEDEQVISTKVMRFIRCVMCCWLMTPFPVDAISIMVPSLSKEEAVSLGIISICSFSEPQLTAVLSTQPLRTKSTCHVDNNLLFYKRTTWTA